CRARMRRLPTTEGEAGSPFQIETDFDDIDGLLEVGIGHKDGAAASGRGADERGRIVVVVELVVVPLNEAGEPVGEGVFAADAGRPSAPAVVVACGGNVDPFYPQGMGGAQPGAAALGVEEKAVPGIADAPSDGCARLDLRVVGERRAKRVGENHVGAVGSGTSPVVVALDAEYPIACLIIAADLQAAEPAP